MFNQRIAIIALLFFGLLNWGYATNIPQVVSAQEYQQAQARFGSLAVKRLHAWQALIDKNQHKPERLKLDIVNKFFNQATYTSDKKLWHKQDYWETPYEFLTRDAGDCEDYVIAKYFTLKALHVPEKKIYLTYVKSLRLRQAHMVLTYFKRPKSVPLVLDSLTDRILKATRRKDLVPIYSFNGDGLWLAKQRGTGFASKGDSHKLKSWTSLLKKIKAQRTFQ